MAEKFERFEKKYLLDQKQYALILQLLNEYMIPDKFYKTRVNSIYYDTNNYQLIRRSLEKPEYKEKLRIRTYGPTTDEDKVYVEFKKKFDGIVYKRRTKARCSDVLKDIYHCDFKDEQIAKEIKYALNYYDHLKPAFFISCMRTSFIDKNEGKIRITFDNDIVYRTKHLSLNNSDEDKKITDNIIMELKVIGSMPLWLADILEKVKAYPRGFSKVGTAFELELKGERL